MKNSEKALKKFVGERAYQIIRNSNYDLEALKKALVTPNNARAVFENMNENQIRGFVSKVCNTQEILRVERATQEEIKELFAKGGYDTVIFDDYDAINECRKYYAEGERICTYNNLKRRMKDYHMIVALRKDIDKIEREENPTRDGLYGTSIINIQLAKNGSHISIKNRYNHTVNQCDSTYDNDMDNIYQGLHNKVLGYYDFVSSNQRTCYLHVVEINGVYLKYFQEANNVYYGDFALSNNNGIEYIDHSRYYITSLISGWYGAPAILDFKNKEVIKTDDIPTKSALLTRALKEGILHSGNKTDYNHLSAIFPNAKKELLNSNHQALQSLHDRFGYDFNKPFEIIGFLGNFTAKKLAQITGREEGLLLICKRDELNVMEFNRGTFETSSYSTYIGPKISFYHHKKDFEQDRKNSTVSGYFLYQDEEYIIPAKNRNTGWESSKREQDFDKSGNYMPAVYSALRQRLYTFKQGKKLKEAQSNNYVPQAEKYKKDFIVLKEKIMDCLSKANTSDDFKKFENVFSWWNGTSALCKKIEKFDKNAKEKSFSCVVFAEESKNDIEKLFERIYSYLKEE